jgi:hypothetical protein
MLQTFKVTKDILAETQLHKFDLGNPRNINCPLARAIRVKYPHADVITRYFYIDGEAERLDNRIDLPPEVIKYRQLADGTDDQTTLPEFEFQIEIPEQYG